MSACQIHLFCLSAVPVSVNHLQLATFHGLRTHVEFYIFQIFLHPDVLIGHIITAQ